ncbi:MAG: Protein AaeX [Herbaspirillum frisingense]|uniref:Protein AaeX n=1 Tax=Herbaspirillum frisingense TaxID=92645 RepID=A0A7V8JTJ4_9BURK|nr:MAG: Protein AaeX [Herbaspirillum frisingense]
MPREISFFDAYIPTVLLLVIVAAALALVADRILVRFGFYDLTWHPALFRVSMFVCFAALMGLYVYR